MMPRECGAIERVEVPPVQTVSAVMLTHFEPGGMLRICVSERLQEQDKGQLVLPGGKLEQNESLENAAVRELWEETGLVARPDNLRYLKRHDDLLRTPDGQRIAMNVFSILWKVLGWEMPQNKVPTQGPWMFMTLDEIMSFGEGPQVVREIIRRMASIPAQMFEECILISLGYYDEVARDP